MKENLTKDCRLNTKHVTNNLLHSHMHNDLKQKYFRTEKKIILQKSHTNTWKVDV